MERLQEEMKAVAAGGWKQDLTGIRGGLGLASREIPQRHMEIDRLGLLMYAIYVDK